MGSLYLLRVLMLVAAGAICWLLHLGIGRAQRRILRRLMPQAVEGGTDTEHSMKRLLVDWGANGLRTSIWILYFAFLLNLLPQTQDELGVVSGHVKNALKDLLAWLQKNGVSAVVVAAMTVFLMRFAAALIRTGFLLFERRATSERAARVRRRAQTLSAILRGASQAAILFIGLMILLEKLTINITPILASAGIVGIAVGFGAQSLVKDIFAGFLILLEDQYGVGDSVKIGEVSGTVERLTLRSTWVRGLDGSLTTIPNGSISAVANLSKDWARAVLDVEVDYHEDIDRAMRVMIETARGMKEEMPQVILDEPVMLGVDKLTGTSIVLRLILKTAPAQQAEIGRELRRRIKLAFDREGVRVPSGQQQLILSSPPAPREAAAIEQLVGLSQQSKEEELK